MVKRLYILLSFCLCNSLMANGNKVEILQQSQKNIYQGTLECQNPISAGSFQNCWLRLIMSDKPIENATVFVNGGMPTHGHGLPTSPKAIWTKNKNAYLIKGLKFSMPGQWKLSFKVIGEKSTLKDEIIMLVAVN